MGLLADSVAVITGAARGIGQAIAARYAEEGAKVALLDADGEAVDKAAAEIGAGALGLEADVADETSVANAVAQVASRLGPIEILVNNAAAAARRTPITELPLNEWEQALRINLTGAFLVTRTVLPSMIAARRGVIINVASQLGSVAIPNSAAYCTTKGGLLQFTRALALDHAADGIRVNSLSPGAVLTPRLTHAYGSEAEAERALAPKHPIGRIGRAEEIAGAAVFLASPDATFMTGADLVVDGGYLAQ